MSDYLYSDNEFNSWITNFLFVRGLSKPDQRPLYEYHTSIAEYLELKNIIINLGSTQKFKSNQKAAACFVLFCAEWYRREYINAFRWSWDPIWEEIRFTVGPNDRDQIVKKGLEDFWGRSISIYDASNRRNILGSVFGEGGLPFLTLRETGNRFQILFSKIFKSYDSYQRIGLSVEKLIFDLIKGINLPQFLQESPSIDLLVSMTRELVSLVNVYKLDEKAKPIESLDNLHPKWRERFPLPLDIETGKDLISSFLSTASTELKRKENIRLECNHFFYKNDSEKFHTEIKLPKKIRFKLINELPSYRLELAIYEGSDFLKSLGFCYAEEDCGLINIKPRLNVLTIERHQLNTDLRLVVQFNGLEVGFIVLPNSLISINETPIGFVLEDEEYKLVGQSSFRVKASEILLLVPANSTIINNSFCSFYKQIYDSYAYKVAGTVKLNVLIDDDMFCISLSDNLDVGDNINLVGVTVDWETNPKTSFVGVPEPVFNDENLHVDNLKLNLFISKEKYIRSEFDSYGSHYITIKNERSESLLRRKIGILPPDFHVELERGSTPNEGVIWIKTQEYITFELIEPDIILEVSHYEEYYDYMLLRLTSESQPPSSVLIRMHFDYADSGHIDIRIPFPATGYLACDSEGNKLARSLSIPDLLGARLYLFGTVSETKTIYSLSLSLRGEKKLNPYIHWDVYVGDVPIEINLYLLKEQIEQLLSLQRGVDRYVEFYVNSQPVCRISRYSTDLVLDRSRGVAVLRSEDNNDYEKLNPIMISLTEPEKRPIKLEPLKSQGVKFGEYVVPMDICINEPHLIIPSEDSNINFRPERVYFIDEPKEINNKNFQSVLNIRDAIKCFDLNKKVSLLDRVIEEMSLNFDHKGWNYIKTIYEKYGYLPLATFESWLALMRNPKAIAMAVFKFEASESFIARLESRFPFIWEMFPVKKFIEAEKIMVSTWTNKGIPEQSINEVIHIFYNNLVNIIPGFDNEISEWLKSKGTKVKAISNLPLIVSLMNSWYQDLLTNHNQDDWPEIKNEDLKSWVHKQDFPYVLDIDVEHRYTVVYLPFFCASVAAERVNVQEVFDSESEMIFYVRQVKDFDPKWFYSVYKYALSALLDN